MKIGIRNPNIERSVKARTIGKVNRKVKGTINPLYGKNGMGYINNPKKAIYNKFYNKTSTSITQSFIPKKEDGILVGIIKLCFLPVVFTLWIFYYFIKFMLGLFNKNK